MAEAVNTVFIATERGQTGISHWGVGLAVAVGLHIGAALMALSSGAGLSLGPEGGGGTGGMTVMMGGMGDGTDAENEVAAAFVAPPEPEPEPVIEAPKPEPIPEIKPIPVAKPKPKPKPKPKVKPKPKARPAAKSTVSKRVAQTDVAVKGSANGKVGATGAMNRRAGGGPIGPSVGAGHTKGFGIDTALKAYKREMHRLLMRKKRYPRSAQRLNQQGLVKVSFVVAPSGAISAVTLKSPSKYPSLNRESKNLLKRIRKFPPMPAKVSTVPKLFTFSIPFRLR